MTQDQPSKTSGSTNQSSSQNTYNKIKTKFLKSTDFLPYIEQIRFPEYKLLRTGLEINFESPITALLGPNGTNKSSILHALAAAPEGRSLAPFWFSTELDDIDRSSRGKATHRFIYKYTFNKTAPPAECRKYRGSKRYRASDVPKPLQGKKDPDYWEPTKRVDSDGMAQIPKSGFDDRLSANRDRWNQIEKPVLYLDFRSELSAFDKYIHHQSFSRWTPDATRKRFKAIIQAPKIARALHGGRLPKEIRAKIISDARDLAATVVQNISDILGKDIARISIVEHKLFGPSGYTVLLQSRSGSTYSEAHAGSGEYAIIRLVDAISKADKSSLILLDEPEVSLHPGAQIRLIDFIKREVLRQGHQVVLSTHSTVISSQLPNECIKVLGFDTRAERVVLVADGCTPTEASAHLGHATTPSSKPKLFVEDDLAKEIVKASLRRHSPVKLDSLNILPFPGGADGIIKNILPILSLSDIQNYGILLDGDQDPENAQFDSQTLNSAKSALSENNAGLLREIWTDNFHITEPFTFSHSDHSNDCEVLFSCIIWASEHLDFLHGRSPEQALAEAENPAIVIGPHSDWKQFWIERYATEMNITEGERTSISSFEILSFQIQVLARLDADCSLLKTTSLSLERIISW